jgi:hypothetical protein
MIKSKAQQHHFGTTERTNVPNGRNGKHKAIVTAILKNLEELERAKSLKIPIAELPDTVVKIRSALNRATRKGNKSVATAVDDNYFYIWNS